MSAGFTSPNVRKQMEKVQAYADDKVRSILRQMVEELFFHMPDDPVDFMINHLQELKRSQTRKSGRSRRRGGVSAESVGYMNKNLDEVKPLPNSVPLDAHERPRVLVVLRENLLFSELEEETLTLIVEKMMRKSYAEGDVIIKAGEEGNHMFVLNEGTCDCFVERDGMDVCVKSYVPGESFGELALMYGDERAATIKATSSVVVGVIDRLTFRANVMHATSSKRERYEEFLEQVSVLTMLDKYERATVADALKECSYSDGEYIIHKGDEGDEFFIVSKGSAIAQKRIGDSNQEEVVKEYSVGDYFGELALVHNTPRAADVIAQGETKCVKLDRDSFERLLGPCQAILNRSKEQYDKIERQLAEERTEVLKGGPVVGSPSGYRTRRRLGVSSMPTSDLSGWKPAVHAKTAELSARIKEAVKSNMLYANLPQDTMQTIVDAMFECKFSAGDYIIRQGAAGDNFYVVDHGTCDCYLNQPDGQDPLLVKTYQHGETFGELALMYNAPRAASIKARDDCVLYALDGKTFRSVLMVHTSQKRKMYEKFLESVPLLAGLDKYERAKVADSLDEIEFEDGEYVITMNERGDTFYIVVEGKCVATKPIKPGGEAVQVLEYHDGSYFGELALLNDTPRAANIIARGSLKAVSMNRSAFTRLFGPVSDILKRTEATYRKHEENVLKETEMESSE